jgi:surface antigen
MKKHGIAIILLSLGMALPAAASNWSVFANAPISRMSKDDVAAFQKTVVDTLEKGEDGKTVEWTGKEPNVNSKITPIKDYIDRGLRCRDVRIETEAKDLYARGTYTMCKTTKGDWGFRTPPAPERSSKPVK